MCERERERERERDAIGVYLVRLTAGGNLGTLSVPVSTILLGEKDSRTRLLILVTDWRAGRMGAGRERERERERERGPSPPYKLYTGKFS